MRFFPLKALYEAPVQVFLSISLCSPDFHLESSIKVCLPPGYTFDFHVFLFEHLHRAQTQLHFIGLKQFLNLLDLI